MGRRPELHTPKHATKRGLTRGADEVVHVAEHLAHRVEGARRCDRVRHDAPPLLLPVVDGRRALVASPEEERVELLHFRSGEVLAVPRQRVAEVGVVVGVTVVVASPTPTGGGDGPSVVVVGLLLGVEHVVLGCCGGGGGGRGVHSDDDAGAVLKL